MTVNDIPPQTLTFAPSIDVVDTNSSDNSDSASMSVLGTSALSVSPISKAYGTVALGQTSSQTFTLQNNGTATLNVGALAVEGTGSAALHISGDTCSNQSLTPDQSCTVNVRFAPTATGALVADLVIPSDAASSQDSVSLTGYSVSQRLLNPGFNTYARASSIPARWTANRFTTLDGKDTTVKQQGTASVRITGQTGKIKQLQQTLSIGGTAGDPLILSYWVRGSLLPKAGLCQAQVFFYAGSARVGTPLTLPCGRNGTFAFQQKTLTLTAPSAYTSVKVVFTYSKASGKVWFDGVNLMK